jgi:hypothetical protein
VPDGEQRIYLDLAPAPEPAPSEVDPSGLSRSRAFRLERTSDRGFSSLRFLSSSLAQFPMQRDLALIEANVAHSRYAVYRERLGTAPDEFDVSGEEPHGVLADGSVAPFHPQE